MPPRSLPAAAALALDACKRASWSCLALLLLLLLLMLLLLLLLLPPLTLCTPADCSGLGVCAVVKGLLLPLLLLLLLLPPYKLCRHPPRTLCRLRPPLSLRCCASFAVTRSESKRDERDAISSSRLSQRSSPSATAMSTAAVTSVLSTAAVTSGQSSSASARLSAAAVAAAALALLSTTAIALSTAAQALGHAGRTFPGHSGPAAAPRPRPAAIKQKKLG